MVKYYRHRGEYVYHPICKHDIKYITGEWNTAPNNSRFFLYKTKKEAIDKCDLSNKLLRDSNNWGPSYECEVEDAFTGLDLFIDNEDHASFWKSLQSVIDKQDSIINFFVNGKFIDQYGHMSPVAHHTGGTVILAKRVRLLRRIE